MANRFLRFGILAVPAAIAATALIVAACSVDEPLDSANGTDASTDSPVTVVDGSRPDTSTSPFDSGTTVDASDAGADADAAPLPALCLAYPNVPTAGDAAAMEPPDFPRYMLIALRAIYTGTKNAVDSCEIGPLFPDNGIPPEARSCLGEHLAALAGCKVGATPVDYSKALDENLFPCTSADGGPEVQIGFKNPKTSTYTPHDVAFFIDIVRQAALSTGMAVADADQLKALLEAEAVKAGVVKDAGGGDAGFSMSACPP